MAVAPRSCRVFGMRSPAAAPNSYPHRVASTVAVAFAALLLLPAAARAASYWVGNGGSPPCTHATLQAAIDTAVGGAGSDVIHLVGPGPFQGPFIILGGSIEIVGNVASCGNTASVGYSTLRAASGARPLSILMGQTETVRLRRLVVTTQGGHYDGDGGAIWFAAGTFGGMLELVDTQVRESVASGDGGGVYVSRGRLRVLGPSLVFGNGASRGGGIAAANQAVVELDGANVIGNTALLDGGGIFADDAFVAAGSFSNGRPAAVASNVAGRDGGGLYLGPNAHTLSAWNESPHLSVTANFAQRGGGVFLWGGSLRLNKVSLDNNQASGEGGALWAGGDGSVTANAFGDSEPTRGGFPRFDANVAAEGAALYLDDAAAILASGRMHGHQAGAGGAVLAVVVNGILHLHGVVVDANQMPALFALENATLLQLEHLTLSGNTVGGFVRWRGTSSEVIFASSILDETEPFFASFESPSTSPQIACIVSRHSSPFASVPPGTDLSGVTYTDPQLVSPPFDFHLRHTSPAIDRCGSLPRTDNDGDERSRDDRYHPNDIEQTADAGADEAWVYFVDGFESGNRGQWSGSSP